jgi:hypothetical protein
MAWCCFTSTLVELSAGRPVLSARLRSCEVVKLCSLALKAVNQKWLDDSVPSSCRAHIAI